LGEKPKTIYGDEAANAKAANTIVKLKWDGQGGMKVDAKGKVQSWTWNPKSWQTTGHPPTEAISVKLNKNITCAFTSRQDIKFSFACEAVLKNFDCSEKLRRTESYLESGAVTRGVGGKLILSADNRRTLSQRHEDFASDMRLTRAKINPRSDAIENSKLSGIMKGLEDYFTSDFNVTRKGLKGGALDEPVWDIEGGAKAFHEEAIRRVKADIPTMKPFVLKGKRGEQNISVEVPNSHNGPICMVKESNQKGKTWKREDGQYMNYLEIRDQLMKENPVLPRSKFMSLASGRYNMDVPVQNGGPQMIKLTELDHRTFDKFIHEVAQPHQLVVVACLRTDLAPCRKAEQLLTVVNGELKEQANGDSVDKAATDSLDADKIILCKFDMGSSRFLVDRYNIHTVPLYLMFVNGRLVSASAFGGAPVILATGREPPKVLLVESVIKDQVQAEKTLRLESVQCDLALNAEGVRHHSSVLEHHRREGMDAQRLPDPRLTHGIVCVSDAFAESDFNTVTALYRDFPTTMVVKLLGGNAVKVSPKTIFHKSTKRKGKRTSGTPKAKAGGKNKPIACPRTGIVLYPSNEMLQGGRAHFAIRKPIKGATVQYLIGRWRAQDFHNDRNGGSRNNGSLLSPQAMGLNKENLYKEMKLALAKAKKGQFISSETQNFGLMMTSSEVSVRGAGLKV